MKLKLDENLGERGRQVLSAAGHTVTRLVRRRPGPDEARWDPAAGEIDAAALEGR